MEGAFCMPGANGFANGSHQASQGWFTGQARSDATGIERHQKSVCTPRSRPAVTVAWRQPEEDETGLSRTLQGTRIRCTPEW